MATQGSSTNPFRTPPLTRQSTAQSSSSPSLPRRPPQPQLTLSIDGISEDAPPAYTPVADTYKGETAIELGPWRPFQPAPTPSALLLTENLPDGGNASVALDVQQEVLNQSPDPATLPASLSTVFTPPPGRPPPPRHPSTRQPPEPLHPAQPPSPIPSVRPSPPQQSRYDPPPGPPQSHLSPPPGPPQQSRLSPPPVLPTQSHFPPPPGPPPQRRFPPPPGPPPQRRFSPPPGPPPQSHFSPPPGPPPQRRSSPPPGPPPTRRPASPLRADARPTTAPTPGHPLLRQGQTLLYPSGYSCHKCNNTGYKNFDPSHPCHKCWDRFSRPYTSAFAHAPAPSGGSGNFQQPLPIFRPPHAHGRIASETRHSPPSHPPSSPVPIFTSTFAPPPPGAAVVHPGDPRIGGRLCWRCGGSGSINFLIFDRERCEVCKGMGRVFS